MSDTLGYILACVTMLIWGTIFIPVKNAKTSGYFGVAVSMPVGLATLLLVSPFLELEGLDWRTLASPTGVYLLMAGICQFPLATIFYYEGIRSAEVTVAVPLTRLKSIWVVVLAAMLRIETITTTVALAAVLGVVGAVVLTRGKQTPSGPANGHARRGMVFALLAGTSWALGDIFIRYALKVVPPLTATFVSLALGAVVYYMLIACRGQFGRVRAMPGRDKLLYAIHGAVSLGLGYLAFFASIHIIGVSKAAVITSAWPGVAFALGLTLYRERLTPAKAIGFVLLMGSVGLVMVK